MGREYRLKPTRFLLGLAVVLGTVEFPNCAVRQTTRIPTSQLPPPSQVASTADLVSRISARNSAIETLSATVDLEPTAGSVYSGVIKQYRDVRGFILLAKPALIRIIGQAPVVRTNIFDMVSDGKEFRLSVPPKNKFIVGKTEETRPARNSLENLRPQHIFDALVIPAVDPAREKVVREEAEEGERRYYELSILEAPNGQDLSLARKVWFDRSTLAISRLQIYGPEGAYREGVRYSDIRDFGGVSYPARIEVHRPVEDYSLSITILKATFNQTISASKFELTKPPDAELVDLSASTQTEGPRAQ